MNIKKPVNKIEKLIDELCPDGVEFRELGEVCDIGDGLHGTPQYSKTGNYYFTNGNNLNNGRILFDSKTKKVDDSMYEKYGIPFSAEKTIFMSINGTIGSVAHFNNENIVLGKSVAYFNIKSKLIETKYLSYFLRTHYAKEYYLRTATGATIKNLGLKSLRKFKIPIPPLTIQKEIVKILNNFTQLEAVQEAELEARKKQYEHYREALLSFDDGVEFRALGEILNMRAGNHITASKIANRPNNKYTYPCYGGNGVRGFVEEVMMTNVYS